MKCPRCVQPVNAGHTQCARCGFQLASLDEEFGSEVILLERLTDAAHCFRVRERDAINRLLDDFEAEFPQLFASVYIGVLPELTSIRQFGFWLINHAAIPSLDISRPNEQGVLIVVDLQSRVIGVTLGYMLEKFLSEKDLNRCLRAARPHLFAGDFYRGVAIFLNRLSRVLRHVSRRARRRPHLYLPETPPETGKPVFQKLKETGPVAAAAMPAQEEIMDEVKEEAEEERFEGEDVFARIMEKLERGFDEETLGGDDDGEK